MATIGVVENTAIWSDGYGPMSVADGEVFVLSPVGNRNPYRVTNRPRSQVYFTWISGRGVILAIVKTKENGHGAQGETKKDDLNGG